ERRDPVQRPPGPLQRLYGVPEGRFVLGGDDRLNLGRHLLHPLFQRGLEVLHLDSVEGWYAAVRPGPGLHQWVYVCAHIAKMFTDSGDAYAPARCCSRRRARKKLRSMAAASGWRTPAVMSTR